MAEPAPMRHAYRWPRFALVAAALVFATCTLLYSFLWIFAVRSAPIVELGFSNLPSLEVNYVYKGGPAEKAGLRAGDRLLTIGQIPLVNGSSVFKAYASHMPGDKVQLTVSRPGQSTPVTLTAIFRRRHSVSLSGSLSDYFTQAVRRVYPMPFVVVGLIILFFRLNDPKVWLLALLFTSFTTTPAFPSDSALMGSRVWPFLMAYQAFFFGMLAPLFYWFFAVFPIQSPLDRRAPWLKWVSLALGFCVGLPGVRAGRLQLPAPLVTLLGEAISQQVIVSYVLVFLTLGLVSLAGNYFRSPDLEARRKIRVIFWATVTGLLPRLIQIGADTYAGVHTPNWLDVVLVALTFLIPLAFAYAVVKHRVLEIPVLLKRSARYVLVQRGFTILLSLSSIGLMLLFALSFPRYLHAAADMAQPSGIALGAIFGTALLWGGSQVHRQVRARIDRFFFRSAYDARMILEDLAEEARAAIDRGQLAHLLERHIDEALHPSSLTVYLRGDDDQLVAVSGVPPPQLKTISADLPILADLASRGRPWEFLVAGENGVEASVLVPLHPECLVPILGHGGRLEGLLVLGARLSEEPYSGDDKRLLASVAAQAGTAHENIRLAEEIAERMEAERRISREMEIAKDVQSRLLPQAPPVLKNLDSAGQCIQARSVGGDYFDFLDLGPGRVGFVLADVSGKGVHAALLMANLQAHLRSQSGIAPDDPESFLEQVNLMMWKSTAPQHYATLFFASYDDATRRLAYVNCGHNPPILLRQDGAVERLPPTATVIGLFEKWQSTVPQVQLAPGDLLAIFSDGVTEAIRGDEEFGEARLIQELKAASRLPVNEIITAIFARVQQFNTGPQYDDLTLLIARVRVS